MFKRFAFATIGILTKEKSRKINNLNDLSKINDIVFYDLENRYKSEKYFFLHFLMFSSIFTGGIFLLKELIFVSVNIQNILVLLSLVVSFSFAVIIKRYFLNILNKEKVLRTNRRAMNLYLK